MNQKKDWTREHLEEHYVNKMKAVTIPVNVSISGSQRILDFSELKAVLKDAKVISQARCYCREKMGNCIEPMDGCLSLDDEALRDIEKGDGKQISQEEALKSLQRTHEAGLVHMAYIYKDKEKPDIICSCCRCCCHSLSAALRFGYSDHVLFSKKIAKQNQDLCEDCGDCVDFCQFRARTMEDGALSFISEKCAGCGVCLTRCPSDAITMVEREEVKA